MDPSDGSDDLSEEELVLLVLGVGSESPELSSPMGGEVTGGGAIVDRDLDALTKAFRFFVGDAFWLDFRTMFGRSPHVIVARCRNHS